MRRRDVKTVIAYYFEIPDMRKGFTAERARLESEYDGLRGTSYDGVPHSSTPGKPTEMLAIKMEESNAWGRIQEIGVKVQVLQADEATIRGCMDALNGRYKSLLNMKYFRRYSWAKISASLGTPEATARRWNDKALDRLGELLDDTPMVEELLGRASRARIEVSKTIFVTPGKWSALPFGGPLLGLWELQGRRPTQRVFREMNSRITGYFPDTEKAAGKTICE